MASSYSGSVTAMQVGSYFVGQYYQVLKEQPDLAHQFYSESSSMVRVDGDSNEPASSMLEIHGLLTSLNLTAIEVKTINALHSWNGGVVVMVSGLVKTKDFNKKRKFVQTFFLAPQEQGYFVLNDIFQFLEEDQFYLHPTSITSEDKVKMQLNASNPLPEPPYSNYLLEEGAAREFINSVNIEDNSVDEYGQEHAHGDFNQDHPADEYNIPEQHQYEEVEQEPVLDNAYAEGQSVPVQSLIAVPLTSDATDEPEELKKTYASILRVAKGPFVSAVSAQPTVSKPTALASDWSYVQTPPVQQSNSAGSVEPEAIVEAPEDGYMEDEGLSKSVYVRNLPSTVTEAEIADVFKNFGKIIPDGVAIKLRKEIGICYAFVEFEDMVGVYNAIKNSPVQLAGKTVYIEERRANSLGAAARGGRRGRGRGGYPTDSQRGGRFGQSFGRGGGNLEGSDYTRARGNGSYTRGSR